ncbi:MAG: lipocalin family protein [Methylococcales bacterium]|nr:lipocalin family protein [Methylococcales bacterium]
MQIKLPAAIALLISCSAFAADLQLTRADLLGAWQIDKESMHSDGSNAKEINTVWTFREDGTMEGTSDESSDKHARINQVRAVLNYSIEDGKLVKQAAPGRSKMETCSVVERTGQQMVLKCQTVYFFMTKK